MDISYISISSCVVWLSLLVSSPSNKRRLILRQSQSLLPLQWLFKFTIFSFLPPSSHFMPSSLNLKQTFALTLAFMHKSSLALVPFRGEISSKSQVILSWASQVKSPFFSCSPTIRVRVKTNEIRSYYSTTLSKTEFIDQEPLRMFHLAALLFIPPVRFHPMRCQPAYSLIVTLSFLWFTDSDR